jgi:hypothetical protein
MAGFVPSYLRAAGPFEALTARLPTRYGDGLPSWLAAGLGGSLAGRPILPGPALEHLASAESL